MNRPTALFFAAAHMHYGGDEDAVGVAYDLVRSTGFTGFGRERRWAALEKVAPDLAEVLRQVGSDVAYVDAGEEPRRAYRAVVRETTRAQEWLVQHGGPLAPICVALGSCAGNGWPELKTWKYAVWSVVNYFALDDVDRATGSIPLPRDTREALFEA